MTLCINCAEDLKIEIEATHKYHQLDTMCEKHYNHAIALVEAFGGKVSCPHSHLLKDQKVDPLNMDTRTTWDS
jgi:hypothetical protein